MNSCIIAFLSWKDWQKYRLLYILYCILFIMVHYQKKVHTYKGVYKIMPLLSTLYFVGTAMFDYFEVNLWLALYGVCIEAKQVIIKNKIKCCKNTNHGVGLLDPRLTFSPLVTGHFSCSEWDHSYTSVTVFHLYLFWEGKVVFLFVFVFYLMFYWRFGLTKPFLPTGDHDHVPLLL